MFYLLPEIEFNAQYVSPHFTSPIQLELTTHCINPFDTGLNKFINRNRRINAAVIRAIIQEAQQNGFSNVSLKEANEQFTGLRIKGGPGIGTCLSHYLLRKGMSIEYITDLFSKHKFLPAQTLPKEPH